MAQTLESRIETLASQSPDGSFKAHKVFKNFYINDKYCPPYERLNAHLVLQYSRQSATKNSVSAQSAAQEAEETKQPVSRALGSQPKPGVAYQLKQLGLFG